MEQPDRVHQLLVSSWTGCPDVHRRAALAVLAADARRLLQGHRRRRRPERHDHRHAPHPRPRSLRRRRRPPRPGPGARRRSRPGRPDRPGWWTRSPAGSRSRGARLPAQRRRDRHRAGQPPGAPHPRAARGGGPRHDRRRCPTGGGGLLGVAVSPDFARDRLLFFYVTTATDNRVVRATYDRGRLGPLSVVLDGIPRGVIHDGGRLAFGPDGFLYVSTGETGDPAWPRTATRSGARSCGSRPTATPPPATRSRARRSGLRPPQRAGAGVRRPGPAVGLGVRPEHLRRAQPDRGRRQLRLAPGRGPRRAGRPRRPAGVWATDVASPSGLAFLDGRLWLASLRGQRLWRIDVTGQRARDPQDFFVGTYGRMRTVAVAPDGRLWVTTSNRDGRGAPAASDDRILLIE